MHLVVGIFSLLAELLRLFSWALILSAIISTLISFGVLDTRNRFVWMISDFLYRVTEPVVLPLLSDLEGAVVGSMLGQS